MKNERLTTEAGTNYTIKRSYRFDDDVPGRMGFYHVFVEDQWLPITDQRGFRYKRDCVAWAEENQEAIDEWGKA